MPKQKEQRIWFTRVSSNAVTEAIDEMVTGINCNPKGGLYLERFGKRVLTDRRQHGGIKAGR